MQSLRCQTCFPSMTGTVSDCSLVSVGNCRWLSIVMPMNTRLKIVVPVTKNRRVCRFVMLSPMRCAGGRASDADAGVVADANPEGVNDGDDHDQQDDKAQDGTKQA